MGFDFSELDAQLSALGHARADALVLARKITGDLRSLDEVDQLLASLGAAVPVPESQERTRAALARPASPQLVAAAPVAASPSEVGAEVPSERARPPRSEEIALPDPVHHDPTPRSGELALDAPSPRSGSFALDPAPSETNNLHEDTDADFEAEFAALSARDADKVTSKSVRPAALPQNEKQSVAPHAEAATKHSSLPPAKHHPLTVEEDEETDDALLALFDAEPGAPENSSKLGAAPMIGGLSDELEPSVAPPSSGHVDRDPDAEFDALFDEASSPSSIPAMAGKDPEQDSVDDLLRDLGSPRVPQDLKARAERATAASREEDELEDPTGIFDSSAFDAVTGGKSEKGATPDLDEDELEIDMELEEDVLEDAPAKAPVPPPKRPPAPPAAPGIPGGVEKRPSFLGRLFGGPNKDGNDKS